MNKEDWKAKIETECRAAGTYRDFFDSVIDTLAGIMETRDNAQEKFDESGGDTVITYTNKGGVTNTVKNPALMVLMDCNTQALSYWRDLGLTPAGYKKLNADVVREETSTFDDILGKLMEDEVIPETS